MPLKSIKKRISEAFSSQQEPSVDEPSQAEPLPEELKEPEPLTIDELHEKIRQQKTQIEILRQSLNKAIDVGSQNHKLAQYNAKLIRMLIDHYDETVNRINRIKHDPGHWGVKILFFCMTTISLSLTISKLVFMLTPGIMFGWVAVAITAAISITIMAYAITYYVSQAKKYQSLCKTKDGDINKYIDDDLSFMGSSNFYKDFVEAGEKPVLRRDRTQSMDFANRATSPDAFFRSESRDRHRAEHEEKEQTTANDEAKDNLNP